MKRILILITTAVALISCGDQKGQTARTDYALPDTIDIVRGNGRVVPQSGILNITSEVSGMIKRICVTSGQRVHKGDTIMVLDAMTADLNLNRAHSKMLEQQSAVKVAQSDVSRARLDMETAQSDLERSQRLYANGAESHQTVADKEADVRLKRLTYEQSLHRLEMSRRSLADLQDGVGIARQSLRQCLIVAPTDGEILDIDVERGETVKEYNRLATFAVHEPIIVEAEVDELFANRLEIGQQATIHLIGYPDTIGTGHIYSMMDFLSDKSIFSGETSEQQDRQMRKIKILLDDQEHTPLIGSKVGCNISL